MSSADELLPILNRQTTHALSDGSAIQLSGCLDFRLMLYGDNQMISKVALLNNMSWESLCLDLFSQLMSEEMSEEIVGCDSSTMRIPTCGDDHVILIFHAIFGFLVFYRMKRWGENLHMITSAAHKKVLKNWLVDVDCRCRCQNAQRAPPLAAIRTCRVANQRRFRGSLLVTYHCHLR